jgi:hypothetical protein
MQWSEFWKSYQETLAVAAAFAFGGSGFVLWSVDSASVRHGLLVIIAGQVVNAATIALLHGYLGWSIFVAPFAGIVCGIGATPLLSAVMKGIRRVEVRADDITDAGIKRVTGKEAPP